MNMKTSVQQLQNELNELNARRKAVIEDNTVKNTKTESNKSFTYRDSKRI